MMSMADVTGRCGEVGLAWAASGLGSATSTRTNLL